MALSQQQRERLHHHIDMATLSVAARDSSGGQHLSSAELGLL